MQMCTVYMVNLHHLFDFRIFDRSPHMLLAATAAQLSLDSAMGDTISQTSGRGVEMWKWRLPSHLQRYLDLLSTSMTLQLVNPAVPPP